MSDTNANAELGRVLFELGTSADEIATALRAKGIKGVRNTARYLNPIVRYALTHMKAEALDLDVTEGNALRLILDRQRKETILLPQAVLQFLEAFHLGKYPDLEMTSDES
jgi:hypothetical protein